MHATLSLLPISLLWLSTFVVAQELTSDQIALVSTRLETSAEKR
jgi:hypothetical protein